MDNPCVICEDLKKKIRLYDFILNSFTNYQEDVDHFNNLVDKYYKHLSFCYAKTQWPVWEDNNG